MYDMKFLKTACLGGLGSFILSTGLLAQSTSTPPTGRMGQPTQAIPDQDPTTDTQITPPRTDARNLDVGRRQTGTDPSTDRGVTKPTATDCPAGFTRNTKSTSAEECVPI